MKCKNLTIFEGPDGGGKTTAATNYASATGARYVHLGPLNNVKSIGRFYVEAMLPALLGYQDVVMDRCWLSESPYGEAFREGRDRLGKIQVRQLERLAMRCSTHVVFCLPPKDRVLHVFRGRKGDEMLDREEQLQRVYDLYTVMKTDLPFSIYDYTSATTPLKIDIRTRPHYVDVMTAGNIEASTLLVGDRPSGQRNNDMLYQWPFGSMDNLGSSAWLTWKLHEEKISEKNLMWINSSDFAKLAVLRPRIVALGEEADKIVGAVPHLTVPHPMAWARFHRSDRYPLFNVIT